MVIIRALLDGAAPLSRLDSGLSAATSGICVALGSWAVTVLLVASSTRLAATRGGRTHRLLDHALGVLAPGVAGRLLRTALGLGGLVTGVLGSGLAIPTASIAAPAVPTPGPAPTAPDPIAHRVPAAGHHEPPRLGSELWPLSTPAPGQPLSTPAPGQVDSLGLLGFRATPDRPLPTGAPLAEVVVRRGDTLWSIAARQLPPSAAATRIDALWHRWYERNRAVIGADPDLLLPGQVLRAPL